MSESQTSAEFYFTWYFYFISRTILLYLTWSHLFFISGDFQEYLKSHPWCENQTAYSDLFSGLSVAFKIEKDIDINHQRRMLSILNFQIRPLIISSDNSWIVLNHLRDTWAAVIPRQAVRGPPSDTVVELPPSATLSTIGKCISWHRWLHHLLVPWRSRNKPLILMIQTWTIPPT